jgi:hypothetical protein
MYQLRSVLGGLVGFRLNSTALGVLEPGRVFLLAELALALSLARLALLLPSPSRELSLEIRMPSHETPPQVPWRLRFFACPMCSDDRPKGDWYTRIQSHVVSEQRRGIDGADEGWIPRNGWKPA